MSEVGYILRRQLRDAFGLAVKGLPRAVALEIADDANDRTRRSFLPLPELAQRSAAKDAGSVSDALTKLSASGWEFRVPIGKRDDGSPVYAARGRALSFVVPMFDLPESSASQRTNTRPLVRQSADQSTGMLRSPAANAPLTSGPHLLNPLSSLSPQVDRLLSDAGVAPSERDDFIEWIKTAHAVRDVRAWLPAIAGKGDLDVHVTGWRTTRRETPAVPDHCGRCGETAAGPANPAIRNPRFRLVDGQPCPACHPEARTA